MNLVFATATQLGRVIREGEVSSVEVLNAYLQQIAKHNDNINAIATLDITGAKQKAVEADEALARGEYWGMLHGVPITIKDTFATKGLLTTAGYPALKDYIPDRDAIAVERLKAAGAIILGKTNCAALAADRQTNNSLFGRTNNPWNLDYTSGGSTGGGAAAVAAGLSPLELGSDGGGSVRRPAHCCGIYGLKPTDRLVPTLGHLPELPSYPKSIRHVLTVGALARSIEDLKLCLSLIAGTDSRQSEIPPVALQTPEEKPLSSIRIAWTSEFGNLTVDREISLAINNFIDSLTGAGCQIEECLPEFDFELAWQTYGESYGQEILAGQPVLTRENILMTLKINYYKYKVAPQYRNSPLERGFTKAFPLNLNKYMEALTKRDRLIAQMDSFLLDWDVYICPVSSVAAFPHQAKGEPIEVNGIKIPYTTACGGYATVFNFTGHPVVVIPIGQTKSGLPIGVQIVGKRWQDLSLLAIAKQLDAIADSYKIPTEY